MNQRTCPRCFELNAADAEFCSECGVAFVAGSEGSDAEIYGELARANLLRVRGEFEKAKESCLSVLRRYPSNVTAHTLLGDICTETNDLRQAVSWYELALDLAPGSRAEQTKLQSVQAKIKSEEATHTADKLGIPKRRFLVWPYILLVTLLTGVIGFASFVAGRRSQAEDTQKTRPISDPVQVPVDPPVSSTHEQPPEPQPNRSIASDKALEQALSQDSQLAPNLLGAMVDPIGPSALVTLVQPEGIAPDELAQKAAEATMAHDPKLKSVTVRVAVGESVVYGATYESIEGSGLRMNARWPQPLEEAPKDQPVEEPEKAEL